MSVDHYENFPVASWLCPPRLRPPILAIYHFARTADDLADEGHLPPSERQSALRAYRQDLQAIYEGRPPSPRWAPVFTRLAEQARQHALPFQPLAELLDAFEQDTGNPLLPDQAALLDYCRRSANPIGRLLLHLYGVQDPAALARSDAICTALQLINFWQDFSVDHPRGRCYLPADLCERYQVDRQALMQGGPITGDARTLLTTLLDWTEDWMRAGEGLVHDLPGRTGWELRFVVQGGRRVLERIRAMNPDTLAKRPTLGVTDYPVILWRALTMRRGTGQ